MLYMIETVADKNKLVIEKIQPKLRDFCLDRFEKWPYNPCSQCRYRDNLSPHKKGDSWGCIFESCPSSWEFE